MVCILYCSYAGSRDKPRVLQSWAEKSTEKIMQPECIGDLPGRYNRPMWMGVRTEKGLCGAYLEKSQINP